jgi:hypothetical protein
MFDKITLRKFDNSNTNFFEQLKFELAKGGKIDVRKFGIRT